MCAMAVEAVTAGLVLTGIVHADPHEGNMMLADDGRLVFLDFGLMSTVEADIMEAFALGVSMCAHMGGACPPLDPASLVSASDAPCTA